MGLLQKARGNTPNPHRGFLDRAEAAREAEKIERLCMDRLERLPAGGNSGYAALTILKAYFSGNAELIIKRADGAVFDIVESLGVNESACADEGIDLPLLRGPVPVLGYFSFEARELRIDCIAADSRAFAFPLDESSSVFFLLIDKDEDSPKLSSIRKVLHSFPRISSTKPDRKTDAAQKPILTTQAATTAESGFAQFGGSLIIFALKTPDEALRESAVELLCDRLGQSGKAWPLGPSAIAVFLRSELDRELYAHQLLKSMKSSLALSGNDIGIAAEALAADSAGAAVIFQPYL